MRYLNKFGSIIFPVMVLAWLVGGGLLIGAGRENLDPYLVGNGGDSPFNQFEVYSFRHNQHRCFVVVKQDGNIDLDCP